MAKPLSTEQQHFLEHLVRPQFLLRGAAVLMVVHFAALLIGIAFFFLALGLIFGILWLGPYWQPAFRVFTWLFRINDVNFVQLQPTGWQQILLVVKIGIIALLLSTGCWLLIREGFAGQNLIYLIFK